MVGFDLSNYWPIIIPLPNKMAWEEVCSHDLGIHCICGVPQSGNPFIRVHLKDAGYWELNQNDFQVNKGMLYKYEFPKNCKYANCECGLSPCHCVALHSEAAISLQSLDMHGLKELSGA